MNIVKQFIENSKNYSNKKAIIYNSKNNKQSYITYKKLNDISNKYANAFSKVNIKKYSKVVLMIKPSVDFYYIVIALLKISANPIIIDPGNGIKQMLNCLFKIKPDAFIGIPLAHIFRIFGYKYLKSINIWITTGRKIFKWQKSMKSISKNQSTQFNSVKINNNDKAVISFTTGSTGNAKGAIYTHKTMNKLSRIIKTDLKIGKNDMDIATFPAFNLFDFVFGITTVIADIDSTKPAYIKPEKIIDEINKNHITHMFTSPILLKNIVNKLKSKKINIPSIKRIICGGAPLKVSIIKKLVNILPEKSNLYITYGATETLLISIINGRDIVEDTIKFTNQGMGVCVGFPVKGIDLGIIKTSDIPIESLKKTSFLQKNQIGEIIVSGNHISEGYENNPEENIKNKIIINKKIWHRTGDLGWIDKIGRIWFCGRKIHRVKTLKKTYYSICCESIFNSHIHIDQSALVGIKHKNNKVPVICLKLNKNSKFINKKTLKIELSGLADKFDSTKGIKHFLIYKNRFPVDIRHQSKINREKLTLWAQKKSILTFNLNICKHDQ